MLEPKTNTNLKIIIICLSVLSAVLLAAVILLLFRVSKLTDKLNEETSTPDSSAQTSIADPKEQLTKSVESSEEVASAARTATGEDDVVAAGSDDTESSEAAAATIAELTAPDELVNTLAANGNTLNDLSANGCSQIVTVNTNGSSAEINFYTFDGNKWTVDESMKCQGFVGSNGATYDMHEGGYASPKGLFTVGDAFYIYQKPDTGLNTFEITNDTYWVDDPSSAHYNQRMEGTSEKDWNSAEHMIDYASSYEYGFVINYNLQATPGAGSAIFFHVSSNPTAGCVGTDRTMVLKYLAALQASKNPHIIIV
jgi:L,D-peptidoglycan transpeptidase YkuD (ErfK/YbiS/YcfS/YnhG family)